MAGRVCMVVGLGRGGIGESVAKKFSNEGYQIAMLARTKANLDKLEKEIPNSKGYVCDAANDAQVKTVVSDVLADMKKIDVFIYNAGTGFFKPFEETSYEEFELCWRGGPAGLFSFMQALRQPMLDNGGGCVGVTGATASWRGIAPTAAFASAKFALRALCQSLARDLGPKNIHVFHVIVDGVIWMDHTRQWMPNKPQEEFLQPTEIADVYWQMATQPKSVWTTEINIAPGPVHGSMATI